MYSSKILARFPRCMRDGCKGFEKHINGAMLTSSQREAMQKVWRNDQQALIIIHQYLDDATFEIVANATITKQVWEVLQESN